MTYRQKVFMHSPGMICALGDCTSTINQQLFTPPDNVLSMTDAYNPGTPLALGQVNIPLPSVDNLALPFRSRNNQLLLAALQQIEGQVKTLLETIPPHRIGVVLGTSTSGIAEGEAAVKYHAEHGNLPANYHYIQQEIGIPARFLAQHLKLAGPATTISTACSSGAKALASARRLLNLGICDAVITGGVDSLCRLTVNGFIALGAVSPEVCNPFSLNRRGINIGEGAALFILSHEPGNIALCGVGETSDAHHISAPDPTGQGAFQAISQALDDAGLSPQHIDYINLHGTATPQNDKMESLAVNNVFGEKVACSSTKPLTGHTLGAAGALEAGFCWLTLTQQDTNYLPPHCWDGTKDPDNAPLSLVKAGDQLPYTPQYALSNSFAFGGNNIALILGRHNE